MRTQLHTSQKQILSPRFIQAQQILQVNQIELQDFIQKRLDDNPFLEEVEEEQNSFQTGQTSEEIAEDIRDDTKDMTAWDESGWHGPEDSSDRSLTTSLASPVSSNSALSSDSSATTASLTDPGEVIEKTASQPRGSLSEDLIEQLHFQYHPSSLEFKVGGEIISRISKEGYFHPEEIFEIARIVSSENYIVEEVLSTLQTFDPPGIATANLQHSLLVQLERLEKQYQVEKKLKPSKDDIKTMICLEKKIVDQYFAELTAQDHRALLRELKVDEETLSTALHNISLLNPKPASQYLEDPNRLLLPDTYIIERNQELKAIVNRDLIPQVRLNESTIKEWKAQPSSKDFKRYLKEKVDEAKETIEIIIYRETTLSRVVNRLIVVQEEFFKQGFRSLKPYTQSQLASELGLNVSTLSRLVNQKYLHTKWGLISLRSLFSNALPLKTKDTRENANLETTSRSCEETSTMKIKILIKEFIENFPDKKLSDQKITDLLNNQGIQISRRTVAKYRKNLNLLPSFARKTNKLS